MAEPKNKQSNSNSTKTFLAALIASESDLVFHGPDTVVKRLQKSQTPIKSFAQFKDVALNQNQLTTIAKNIPSAATSVLTTAKNVTTTVAGHSGIKSLLDGLLPSAANKLVTRTTRYVVQDELQKKTAKTISSALPFLNSQQINSFSGGISGLITGLSEIVYQPFETFKTRKQTGVKIKGDLFAGAAANATRSGLAAGSFFFFYNFFLGQSKNKNDPSNSDKLKSISGASFATTILTNPIEVAKTRIQTMPKESKTTIVQTCKKIYAEEGIRAFGKGLGFKCLQSPGKSILPFFVFQGVKKLLDTSKKDNVTKMKFAR